MKLLMRSLFSSVVILIVLLPINTNAQKRGRTGIEDRFAEVNGVRLHYSCDSFGNTPLSTAVFNYKGSGELIRFCLRGMLTLIAKTIMGNHRLD